MLEPLSVWRRTLKDLPAVDQGSWVSHLGAWLFGRTTGKLNLRNVIGPVIYTFNRAAFESVLLSATPVDALGSAAQKFASAWEAAATSSPLIVPPGASLGAPSPATTWSAVASLVDPPSILMGKQLLLSRLSKALAVDKGDQSELADAYRAAFLTLTSTVTGVNSLPIPAPLVSPLNATQ